MSVKYVLRYLPIAQKDLLAIFDFIAEDSPNRALSFVQKLDERMGLLERHPLMGRIPRHPRLREDGYRVLIIEAYLVFYIIRGQRSKFIESFTDLAIWIISSCGVAWRITIGKPPLRAATMNESISWRRAMERALYI